MFFVAKKASKAACLLLCALLSLSAAYGQRPEDNAKGKADSLSLKDRMYYGGGFNFGFLPSFTVTRAQSQTTVRSTSLGANATAEYMFTSRFSAGIGLLWLRISYSYGDDLFTSSSEDGITQQYGGHLLARYYFTKRFFVYSELGLVSADVSHTDDKRGAVFRMPLGAGIKIHKHKEAGFLTLSLTYDVAKNSNEGGNVRGTSWNFRLGFLIQ